MFPSGMMGNYYYYYYYYCFLSHCEKPKKIQTLNILLEYMKVSQINTLKIFTSWSGANRFSTALSPFHHSPHCVQCVSSSTSPMPRFLVKKKLLQVHAKPVSHFFIGSECHSTYSLLECHKSQAAVSVRVKYILQQLQAEMEFTGLDTITNHKTDDRKLFLLHDCVQQSCNLCTLCWHHEAHVATSTTQSSCL